MNYLSQLESLKVAVEMAKIICANPNSSLRPCEQSAEDIIDFIRTLEANFNGTPAPKKPDEFDA